MKKLNEFKAFALSKTQMNALAGGISVACLVDGELVGHFNADSIKAAEDYLSKKQHEIALSLWIASMAELETSKNVQWETAMA